MNQDELYESYLKQLKEAMMSDENASNACQEGNFRKASGLYRNAAELYAKAAAILLELVEICSASERPNFERSAERLIATSRELKEYADQLGKKKQEPRDRACAVEDAEEGVFIPSGDIPNVTFEDIAGLYEAKQLILDEIIHPLVYKELYERFHIENNGGLLLFGPPGSGKTMLARAVANKAHMAFFSVRCSDIVGKYFGEAEKHVRALFEAARRAENAVVFLDEAEALACRRGGNSTVMNRLVPELLSQMDGFERFQGHLIVIFATNRPYDIDPAFLRPGRLPNHCYIPLPDQKVRKAFLESKLKDLPCTGQIDVDKLALCTDRFSCADLSNLIKRSCQLPVNRCIRKQKNGVNEPEDYLTASDLEKTLATIHPSVEQAEIAKLEKWMKQMGMPLPKAG